MKQAIILATTFCLLSSGCYFNSAGHLFANASYKATANSNDAKPGRYVYCYDATYYVELPRYRQGKKVLTQYAAWDDDKRTEGPQPTGDTTLFCIPTDFAMYLTGQASSPSTPSYMTVALHPERVKKEGKRYDIVRQGGAYSASFKYDSPYAAWWYTAGVFEWLCVDLPITITENALVVGGAVAMGALALMNHGAQANNRARTTTTSSSTTSSSYSSSSSYSYDDDDDDDYYYTYTTLETCSACGGSGYVVGDGTLILARKRKCSRCNGTGSVEL